MNVKQANLDLSEHTDATISKLHEIAVQVTHLPAHIKLLHSENKITANELSEQLANIKPINVLS